VPQNVFVPTYMFDSNDDLNLNVNLKEDDETHSFVSYNNTRLAFVYDDHTVSLTSVESTTVHLSQVEDTLEISVGNAFLIASETKCYNIESDGPRYNYHGPKVVIPKQESPITICTTNTIGNVRSRRLVRVLLDSGSTVSMIKRSALPIGAVTKDIGESKSIRTLAGQLKTQDVITMQDI
jgi:hypothetical protein